MSRLALIAWCSLIFFLSSQPHLPSASDGIIDVLFKKSAHMFVYAVLFLLTLPAFAIQSKPKKYLVSAFFCLAYAISDEIHQSFVPGRTPMATDVLIDMIGVSLSFLISAKHEIYFLKSKTT